MGGSSLGVFQTAVILVSLGEELRSPESPELTKSKEVMQKEEKSRNLWTEEEDIKRGRKKQVILREQDEDEALNVYMYNLTSVFV